MTKAEAMKEHIALREQFFQIKYTRLQLVYAKFCMTFIKQDLLESASRGLRANIERIGNVSNLRKEAK